MAKLFFFFFPKPLFGTFSFVYSKEKKMSAMTNTMHFHRPNLRHFPSKSKPTTSPKLPTPKTPFGLTNKCFFTGKALGHSTRTHRAMFELVKASAFRDNNNNGNQGLKTLEQEAFVDGSPQFRSNRLESILNRLVCPFSVTAFLYLGLARF